MFYVLGRLDSDAFKKHNETEANVTATEILS